MNPVYFNKKVESIIKDNNIDRVIPHQRTGRLDNKALYRVKTGSTKVFEKKMERYTKNYRVNIVIDLSSSMVTKLDGNVPEIDWNTMIKDTRKAMMKGAAWSGSSTLPHADPFKDEIPSYVFIPPAGGLTPQMEYVRQAALKFGYIDEHRTLGMEFYTPTIKCIGKRIVEKMTNEPQPPQNASLPGDSSAFKNNLVDYLRNINNFGLDKWAERIEERGLIVNREGWGGNAAYGLFISQNWKPTYDYYASNPERLMREESEMTRFEAAAEFCGMLFDAYTDCGMEINVIPFATECGEVMYGKDFTDGKTLRNQIILKWIDQECGGATDPSGAYHKAAQLIKTDEHTGTITVVITDGEYHEVVDKKDIDMLEMYTKVLPIGIGKDAAKALREIHPGNLIVEAISYDTFFKGSIQKMSQFMRRG